jgi:hypothetical protein
MSKTTSTLLENPDTEFSVLTSLTDSLIAEFPEITEEERDEVQHITKYSDEQMHVVRA